jgi:hypothetical protein
VSTARPDAERTTVETCRSSPTSSQRRGTAQARGRIRSDPRGTTASFRCRGAPGRRRRWAASRQRRAETVIESGTGRVWWIGGAHTALVGIPAERSLARPLAASTRSVGGRRSTARGAGTCRSAADGPGRRAIVPTAPQRGDRARLPHQVCSRSGTECSGRYSLMAVVVGWRSVGDMQVHAMPDRADRLPLPGAGRRAGCPERLDGSGTWAHAADQR